MPDYQAKPKIYNETRIVKNQHCTYETMRAAFLSAFKCAVDDEVAILYKMHRSDSARTFSNSTNFTELVAAIEDKEKKEWQKNQKVWKVVVIELVSTV